MRQRARLAYWLVPVALAVLVLIWWVARSRNPHSIRLANGEEVVLREVTVGTNHMHVAGNVFQRVIAPWASSNVSARLGIKRLKARPSNLIWRSNETLVCWLEREPTTDVFARISDGTAYEERAQDVNLARATLPNQRVLSPFMFASFPRRSRQLTIRIYARYSWGETALAGEFRVNNPVRRDYPPWKAESLPIVRQTNGIEFIITRFDTGLSRRMLNSYAGEKSEIQFTCKDADGVLEPWRPLKFEVTDANGNRVDANYLFGSPGWDRGIIEFDGMLWPDEPAWKVGLELIRAPSARMRSNEVWEVKGVPVPNLGQILDLDHGTEFLGREVVLKRFAVHDAGNRPYPVPIARVGLEIRGPRGLQILMLSATDQRGSNVLRDTKWASLGQMYYFDLYPFPVEVETLDFVFAIHHSFRLEFTAKPRLVPAHKP